jgi:hypothetical protein
MTSIVGLVYYFYQENMFGKFNKILSPFDNVSKPLITVELGNVMLSPAPFY